MPAAMTRPPARHAIVETHAKGQVHVGRLLALLGLAAAAYAWALNPVLASLRPSAARTARQAVLARRVAQAAAENRRLAAKLRHEERVLETDSVRVASLRSTLADLRRQKPPAATVPPAAGNVAVPMVQATTGASGLP